MGYFNPGTGEVRSASNRPHLKKDTTDKIETFRKKWWKTLKVTTINANGSQTTRCGKGIMFTASIGGEHPRKVRKPGPETVRKPEPERLKYNEVFPFPKTGDSYPQKLDRRNQLIDVSLTDEHRALFANWTKRLEDHATG